MVLVHHLRNYAVEGFFAVNSVSRDAAEHLCDEGIEVGHTSVLPTISMIIDHTGLHLM